MPRPMRADARRNYQHILEVARDVFSEHGPEAPLDEIARRAGVGAGTLYRHFPNRDALMEAVYRDDIERISARAYELMEQMPAAEALPIWVGEHVLHILSRKGLAMTLKAALGADSEVFELCKGVMNGAAATLLRACQEAGAVRLDIEPRDVLRMTHAIGLVTETDPEAAPRLLSIMLDGLRPPCSPNAPEAGNANG